MSQAYYDVTSRPLDLSQILLSLHRGTYASLHAFAADMRLMFENYKSFFSDANSEVSRSCGLIWWAALMFAP